MIKSYKKFDVVLVDFNPRKGHVQSGIRPAVIVQSNALNKYASTLIVVPFTTSQRKIYPSQFLVESSAENGLTENSRFLGNQLMVVDKDFVVKKLGCLEKKYHDLLQEALSVVLDWEDDF